MKLMVGSGRVSIASTETASPYLAATSRAAPDCSFVAVIFTAVGDRVERDGRERALRLGDLALLAVRIAAGAEAGLDLAEFLEAVGNQARLGAGALDLLEQAAIGHR